MAHLPTDIVSVVAAALREDIGNGDLTAELIPPDHLTSATIVAKEAAVLCGIAWVNEVFRQLSQDIILDWLVQDGNKVENNTCVCRITGPTRSLLTGERTALNFLQTLSGTATITRHYVNIMGTADCKLLDTRKTIPGLRTAQKFAVACGGGANHRMGLYDAILIKENHILAAGSIAAAVDAVQARDVKIQVEVESLDELQQAMATPAFSVLLDNFTPEQLRAAVKMNNGKLKLEASGGIDAQNLAEIAKTGVDYISIGALTKHVQAIDYSMRVDAPALT